MLLLMYSLQVSGNFEQTKQRLNVMRTEFQEKKSSQSQAKSQVRPPP